VASGSGLLCTACYSCTFRCPRGVAVTGPDGCCPAAHLGENRADPHIRRFYQAFMDTVKRHGRFHEAEFLVRYYAANPLRLRGEVRVGIALLSKGKLALKPPRSGAKRPSRPCSAKLNRSRADHEYAYYPGCSASGTSKECEESIQAVMRLLGVELTELEDWNCCGAAIATGVSYLLSLALPARNLALAERAESELVTGCSRCYMNLIRAVHYTRTTPRVRQKVNELLAETGVQYSGRPGCVTCWTSSSTTSAGRGRGARHATSKRAADRPLLRLLPGHVDLCPV